MHHFIVIGNPISHSKSPQIHHAFARSLGLDISYARQFCPNDTDSFQAVVEAFFCGGGTGANVTLPFKERAYQLCDELSDHAKAAQAVNTLMLKDNKFCGDNTDGRGLVADLLDKGIALKQKSVAILGAGGATRGVIQPLLSAGARVSIFNRTAHKAHTLAQAFDHQINAHALDELSGHFDVIINATSATTTNQALSLGDVSCGVAYDMMYGKPSEFLAHFAKAQTFDGFGMLINQAKLSFEWWTGHKVDLTQVDLSAL